MSPVGQDQPDMSPPAHTTAEFSGNTPGPYADTGDKPNCKKHPDSDHCKGGTGGNGGPTPDPALEAKATEAQKKFLEADKAWASANQVVDNTIGEWESASKNYRATQDEALRERFASDADPTNPTKAGAARAAADRANQAKGNKDARRTAIVEATRNLEAKVADWQAKASESTKAHNDADKAARRDKTGKIKHLDVKAIEARTKASKAGEAWGTAKFVRNSAFNNLRSAAEDHLTAQDNAARKQSAADRDPTNPTKAGAARGAADLAKNAKADEDAARFTAGGADGDERAKKADWEAMSTAATKATEDAEKAAGRDKKGQAIQPGDTE
jgi:hypothetical protein